MARAAGREALCGCRVADPPACMTQTSSAAPPLTQPDRRAHCGHAYRPDPSVAGHRAACVGGQYRQQTRSERADLPLRQ
ncbi:hypothetical protein XHV734_4509 [Xanthomonas hortorum pv. vitians]|nr:hypothetical protein XHV734_4509 [Xanthomonas hortorum pv. vitians]